MYLLTYYETSPINFEDVHFDHILTTIHEHIKVHIQIGGLWILIDHILDQPGLVIDIDHGLTFDILRENENKHEHDNDGKNDLKDDKNILDAQEDVLFKETEYALHKNPLFQAATGEFDKDLLKGRFAGVNGFYIMFSNEFF